jgi:Domain of unknown function (DUF397)
MSMDPDVHGVTWRKSRHSVSNGNCVEAATAGPNGIVVRDSANRAGDVLCYSTQAWLAFIARAKAGKFDVMGH